MNATSSQDPSSTPVVPLPGSSAGKKEQVAGMFDRIARRYDFLNHFLSAGIDKGWRKKAVRSIAGIQPKQVLDVATGTGDLAIATMQLRPVSIIGVDISAGMLNIGRQKIEEKKLSDTIHLQYGDSEALPFSDHQFDAITCGYGVRNFEHLEKGLKEMHRVLRPGGAVAILEFSRPRQFPVKQLYRFYFRYILPTLGKTVSKDQTAYHYLHDSANAFPDGAEFCAILERCGFITVRAQPLTFGITTLYTCKKKG